MLGRVAYYIRKTLSLSRAGGLRHAFGATGEFFRRRVISGELVRELVDYHFRAPDRDIRETLRSVVFESLPKDARRWLIYATFDPESRVQPHVREQLKAFHDLGYAIILVTSSPDLVEVTELAPFCAAILHRRNEGYDFASWRLGYERYQEHFKAAESFVLMNDSCLGPHGDLKTHLERMTTDRKAVNGITKSYEITEYIQSYFFHFGADLIPEVLPGFMKRIRILGSKWSVVRFLEIGSSRWLRSKGIPLRAIIDPRLEPAASLMRRFHITDPVSDPVASELRDRGLLPFYKRSNLSR